MPEQPPQSPSDDRLSIPLDPEEALRALLKVDPESEPGERDEPEPLDDDDRFARSKPHTRGKTR